MMCHMKVEPWNHSFTMQAALLNYFKALVCHQILITAILLCKGCAVRALISMERNDSPSGSSHSGCTGWLTFNLSCDSVV